MERRKNRKLQADTESENESMIDNPGSQSPDAEHAGIGTAPVEQNFSSTTVPVWTDESGLDNPAFEENTGADSMFSFAFDIVFDLPVLTLKALRRLRISLLDESKQISTDYFLKM